jgi:Na+/H+-translocating membrane pyrophosphatase
VDETFVGIKQDAGDGKMKEISDYIYEGALHFLKQNIDY